MTGVTKMLAQVFPLACFTFSFRPASFIIHPRVDDDDGDVDMCFVKGKDKTMIYVTQPEANPLAHAKYFDT